MRSNIGIRAKQTSDELARIINSHLGLEDDNSGNPIITGIDAAAREIAALYEVALGEAEELIDNLFSELKDFPPPAGDEVLLERERAALATERARANELTQELLDAHNSYATERAARIDAGRQAIENWTDALALGKERDDARRERDAERAAREELVRDAYRQGLADQHETDEGRLAEALVAKERLLAELKLRRDVINELEAEVIRLTAALAGAREECAKVADSFWNREVPGYDRTPQPGDRIADGIAQLIAAAIRTLPITEPAKAEE